MPLVDRARIRRRLLSRYPGRTSRADRKAAQQQARRDKQHAKLAEQLERYRAGVASVVAPGLRDGEPVIAAVPAQRSGQRRSTGGGLDSIISNAFDARGNRERGAALGSSAEAIGLPADIDAVVLVATDCRLLVFRRPRSSRLPKGFPRLGTAFHPPGELAAELAYGHLIGVRAQVASVSGATRFAGLIQLVVANGYSHVMASYVGPEFDDGRGPLLTFAATVTKAASRFRR